MIDEKKLFEEINEELCADCSECYGHCSIRLLEEIINKQPKVGEWILCSERLPEYNKMSEYYDSVIVTLDNGRVSEGCYINVDKEWWVDAEDGEHYSINATEHVIAWMPLPEPYKGD